MADGTIKFVNRTKGYGIIIPNEGGADQVFLLAAVAADVGLEEGTAVTYDVEAKNGKESAVNIQRAR